VDISSPGSWETTVSDECMSSRGGFYLVLHISRITSQINFPASIWNWCNKRTGSNEFEARQLRRIFRQKGLAAYVPTDREVTIGMDCVIIALVLYDHMSALVPMVLNCVR